MARRIIDAEIQADPKRVAELMGQPHNMSRLDAIQAAKRQSGKDFGEQVKRMSPRDAARAVNMR